LYMLASKSWRKLTFISLIVGDPRGIWGQQLNPYPIHLPNIIIIIIIIIIIRTRRVWTESGF
jgi:hypothetical protein